MAEICLAQQVSVSAACSEQIPEAKSSAFERVCSKCSLPEGFEVDRDNVRRVPKEDLLALRQWGPNAIGAFRDAPMQFGSFKYCLINDSSDLSRARKRLHKGHPHDEALVLILPGSGSPPMGWSTPSPVEYGQQGVPEGKFRLYVRHKTIVAMPPRGGSARRASRATSTATLQAPPMEGEGLLLEALDDMEELSLDLLTDFDTNTFLESSPAAAPAPAETLGDVNLMSHRESDAKRTQLMRGLEPLQQLLTLGSIPEEANGDVWADFGTLANGKVEIRLSKVQRIVGENSLGRGLFACQDFISNDIITVYGGELVTNDEARLRRDTQGSQSFRYLMRISDSDYLVDGWQYAKGISESPGEHGVFLPTEKDATQLSQGPGPMANHAVGLGANCKISFVPLARSEAFQLFPRVPTLRAIRDIKAGEEIKFDYGSALPFCPQLSLAVTAANDVGSTSAADAATGPSPSSSSAPTPTATPPMQRQDEGPRKRVSTGPDDRQSTVYVSNLTTEEQQRKAKDLIRAGLRMLESSGPLSESETSALNKKSESDIVFRSSAGSTSGDRGASTQGQGTSRRGGSNRRASSASGDCDSVSDDHSDDGPPTIRGMRR